MIRGTSKPVTPTGLTRHVTSYTKHDTPWTEWSDEEFLGYFKSHSKTERALFSIKMVQRLHDLANVPLTGGPYRPNDHICYPYDRAQHLLDLAQSNLRAHGQQHRSATENAPGGGLSEHSGFHTATAPGYPAERHR